jgi:hypothetical protein
VANCHFNLETMTTIDVNSTDSQQEKNKSGKPVSSNMPEPSTASPESHSGGENNDVQLPPPISQDNLVNLESTSIAPRAEIPDSDDFSESSSNDPPLQRLDAEMGGSQLVQENASSELGG